MFMLVFAANLMSLLVIILNSGFKFFASSGQLLQGMGMGKGMGKVFGYATVYQLSAFVATCLAIAKKPLIMGGPVTVLACRQD